MADLPLIDRAKLDLHTFGDAELATELLALFAEQCRALLPAISDTALPPAERADFAHALKGSALGVGASQVAHCAGDLEDALRVDSAAQVPMASLTEAVVGTLAELSPSL